MPPLTLWTIGHSTRTLDEFLALLRAHGIATLADVRTHPGSRKFPHFNQEALAAALEHAGLRYIHLPDLGGRRKPRKDSRNTAWRSASFRGYADYMETPEFQSGLERLLKLGAESPIAFMCSEAVWWRCHRGLISDALKSGGVRILHIEGPREPSEHPYTTAARIVNGRLSYEAGPGDDAGLFPPDD
jgi:uncharacterized protein (DUF488 family)